MTVSKKSISLAGVFPPVVTPFTENGDVHYDALQANLEKLNREPLAGYVIGGSNGEFTSLTIEERWETVRLAKQVTPPGRLLIAGSGAESTRATIDLTERMARLGADVAIVVTPGYFKGKMTAAALEHHYRQAADASPIPILLYSVPGNTGVDLPVPAVAKLAPHPNIIGMKDSGADMVKMGQMLNEAPKDFQLLTGSASAFLASLALGAVGTISALANIWAGRLDQLWACFKQGDLAGARAIQLPLIEVNAAVTSRFGVAGLKAAMDMLGYYGGTPRSPLMPLSDDEHAALKGILTKVGLV
jgi:4-hydroxy-2-oxoglutarate aldolase